MAADPLARPIFVLSPPRAGFRLLARILGSAPGCWRPGSPSGLLPAVQELDPPDGSRGGVLEAADCTPDVRHRVRAHLQVQFARRGRTGSEADAASPRLLHAAPRNALSVPFLDTAFPDATFVYVHRPPADALAEALVLWREGGAVTYPDLPGWTGPAWSFLLVPGWEELSGRTLAEVVTEQWLRTMRTLTDALEELAPDRWCVVGHDVLLRDLPGEMSRLTQYLRLESAGWRPELPEAVRFSAAALEAAREELEPYLERTGPLAERAEDWLAEQRPALPAGG
jgi:hypothetical protein